MNDLTDPSGPIDDLLVCWEELRRAGQAPTPAELCRDHPECLPEVTRRIAILAAMYAIPNQVAPEERVEERGDWPQVPGYEIDARLGQGGMGVVYRATHTALHRIVALKVILLGAYAGPRERMRFALEAEAIAALRHPNIVQVHEAGTTADGCPFLAMEHIAGPTLAARLASGQPSPRQAAALILALASGVEAAHRQGIVHRDLKPANILLDGATPEQPWGVPRIVDFGLARRMEGGADWTSSGDLLGTPAYMAPEQAGGHSHRASPPTDIHALGVLLYEMLTGQVPYRGDTPVEVLVRVAQQEPIAPSRVRPVPRDLEIITLKCLQKAPERRYATAGELADDLRRFLAGEPIRARRVGRMERLVKWARRRPALAALLVVALLALLGLTGAVVGYWYSGRLEKALERAEEQRRRADEARDEVEVIRRQTSYARDMLLAHEAWERARPGRMVELLDGWGGDPELRDWEWHYLRSLRENHAGKLIGKRPLQPGVVSPDGRFLAAVWDNGQGIELGTTKGEPVRTLPWRHEQGGPRIHFSPDSRALVATNGQETKAYASATGEPLAWAEWARDPIGEFFSRHALTSRYWGHQTASSDGKEVAAATLGEPLTIWEAASGKEALSLPEARAAIGVALQPNGPLVAWVENNRQAIELYDRQSRQRRPALRGHSAPLFAIAFGPDGKWLASAGNDRLIKVWDVTRGEVTATFRGHDDTIMRVVCLPDNRRIVSFALDGRVMIWDRTAWPQDGARHAVHSIGRTCVAFSPDGRVLATAGLKELLLWHGDGTPWLRSALPWQGARQIVFAGGPSSVVLAGSGGGVLRATYAPKASYAQLGDLRDGRYEALAVRPGTAGREVVTADYQHFGVERWDLTTRKSLGKLPVPGFARFVPGFAHYSALVYTPDGKRLTLAARDGRLVHWDAEADRLIERQQHDRDWQCLARAPEGRWLAAGANDGTITLWQSDRKPQVLRGHLARVTALAFLPGGRRLASASFDGTVKLWDLRGGLEVLTLRTGGQWLHGLAVSPDGQSLVTVGEQGAVWWWRAKAPSRTR